MSHVRVLHLPVHGVVQKQCVAGTLLYSNVLPLLCPLCRKKKNTDVEVQVSNILDLGASFTFFHFSAMEITH